MLQICIYQSPPNAEYRKGGLVKLEGENDEKF